MKRVYLGAVATVTLFAASSALAADYPDFADIRPSYPQGWENTDDSIRFEFGTAYWYSWGRQDANFTAALGGVTLGDVTLESRDNTHIGEINGKIEDLYTQTYLAGRAGIGLHTTGTYNISPAGSGNIGTQSQIGYAGADYGWMPFGDMDKGFSFGGFVGYQYWKDAPDMGDGTLATDFTTVPPTSLVAARDNLDIHALRLGVKAKADFDYFDVQAELAAVPYAHVSGAVGGSGDTGFTFPGVGTFYETQQTSLTGRGYGIMAETMVGFRPTQNLSLRLGGRAWYVEGELEAKFNSNAGGVAMPELTLPSNYASIFRYGLLAELTGRF